MKLCVIGTGYVGLVTGACLANSGNDVVCVDKDINKIEMLKRGEVPIYEPGLHDIIERNEKEGRLSYTTKLSDGLREAEICFITVDTPPGDGGAADLRNVLAVAKQIGELLDHYAIIVTKSTVPVGTTHKVKKVIADELHRRGVQNEIKFDVANNPEFLKEGNAVSDCLKPARVIVGVENSAVAEKLHMLYESFMRKSDRFISMNVESSEITKYASNAMLASRISFINSLARLCEKVGADISEVRKGMGRDPRIGPDFLFPSLGYGGSCFPKDVKALIRLAKENDVELPMVKATEEVNDSQVEWFWKKIEGHFNGNLNGKRIALWGLAFKPETDDIRCSAALSIIDRLLGVGASVQVFDSVAAQRVKEQYGDKIIYSDNSYQCIEGADALVIATDWNEFRNPNFKKIQSLMKSFVVFDGRNLWDRKYVESNGAKYYCIGR
ncbi:UDP-glucose/GDP-mannose dehydrogenase family protein [bacterium]|nr:UDP-glucose/GDP-mannose dehydrogenase family protein [bacterium]